MRENKIDLGALSSLDKSVAPFRLELLKSQQKWQPTKRHPLTLESRITKS